MDDVTMIAVDWSGARRPAGTSIWLAAVRDGVLVESHACRTREAAIAEVLATPGSVFAGFDFAFSVPAWFARELGCACAPQVWDRAATGGEVWLAPTWPFWRDHCNLPDDRKFRRCELAARPAKSVFQLVGNGQVGAGSVRGMPFLTQLRAAGFAIWPFDDRAERTAVEIYPRLFRNLVPDLGPFDSGDERDAVCSAVAMWRARARLVELRAANDDVTRVEGAIALSDR